MLVLTRKKDERIVLPDLGITITICQIKDKKVRVGFEAPSNIVIHREEVWKKIQDEKLDSKLVETFDTESK